MSEQTSKNSMTRMTRRSAIASLMGGVATLAIGMGVQPALAANGTVKIGLSIAYTGWAAAYDVSYGVGFKFAVDEINASGGAGGKYPIEIIEGADSASSTVEAIKSAEQLLNQDIDVMVLSCDAVGSIAAGRLGQEKGVLMTPATSTQPDVTTKVGDWMYLLNFSDNFSSGALGIFAIEELGAKTAYLLKGPDNPFTEFVPEYFAVAFEKYGGKILGRGNYTFGQADFGGIIAEIKRLPEEPDVIQTAAFEPDLPAFIRQARAAGIKSRIVGADAIDTPSYFALGDLVEGTIIVSNRLPVEGNKYSEVAARFAEEHADHVGNSAWIVGYEAALTLNEAIMRADATDAASIRAALDEIENFEVPNGEITVKGFDRRAMVPIVFIEVVDGAGVVRKAATIDMADIPAPL